MGLTSQQSTPRLIGRKRPLECTPSPPGQTGKTFTLDAEGENTPTYRQEPKPSTSSSQTTPEAQMTRDAYEHEIATVPAIMEAAQDNHFRRLIEEEEEEEKAAQDLIFQPPAKEEEGEEEEDVPSEAASKGKSENEVNHVGSAFLGVVLDAMKATEENLHVDKTILDAQNLEMHVAWVARKPSDLELAK